MSGRIFIPRKDHEVYIVPVNGKNPPRGKAFAGFIRDTLRVSHPGYSDTTAYDAKTVTIKSKQYLIISVIEKNILTEYRLLNRHSLFFTATSLLMAKGGNGLPEPFLAADESAGVNDQGEPYSHPADNPDLAPAREDERIKRLMKTAKERDQVFRKFNPLRTYLIPAALVVSAIVFLVFYYANNRPALSLPPVEVTLEKTVLSSAFEILADISNGIAGAGSVLLHWHYDENSDPVIRISIEGADVETLLEALNRLPYLVLSAVSDIRYAAQKAYYELAFVFDREHYAVPVQHTTDNQQLSRTLISTLRTGITEEGGIIQSEILPAEVNGYSSSIVFSAGNDAAVKIFDLFEKTLGNNKARIIYMDAYFETGRFNVSLTFTQTYDIPGYHVSSDEFKTIATAFGANTVIKAEKAGEPARPPATLTRKAETVGSQREGWVKIGAIRNNDGESFIYYRTAEGKIITELSKQ